MQHCLTNAHRHVIVYSKFQFILYEKVSLLLSKGNLNACSDWQKTYSQSSWYFWKWCPKENSTQRAVSHPGSFWWPAIFHPLNPGGKIQVHKSLKPQVIAVVLLNVSETKTKFFYGQSFWEVIFSKKKISQKEYKFKTCFKKNQTWCFDFVFSLFLFVLNAQEQVI